MDHSLPYGSDAITFSKWLFERLKEIPGIAWDESFSPTHTSYEDFYVWGTTESPEYSFRRNSISSSVSGSGVSLTSTPLALESSVSNGYLDAVPQNLRIVGRVSKHVLRLERQYQIGKQILSKVDPDGKHHQRYLALLRLAPRHADEPALSVIIGENPGYNHFRDVASFGPNWYRLYDEPRQQPWETGTTAAGVPSGRIVLSEFLDFAVGACECLEMLHQGNQTVHGELRGDSFHFHPETKDVRLINLGSGVRAFENGLTSAGWSTLSKEFGVEYKLQFIAPEQTGRLPAAPDARTDIYSLGILFWNLLTGELPFSGSTPLEIMRNVLSRRILPVSTKRIDVPDALSAVLSKMLQKNIDDRYHSAGGLKSDLKHIAKALAEADTAALENFKVGTKDVNCFFNLPNVQIGRESERQTILNVLDRVAKQQQHSPSLMQSKPLSPLSSASSMTADTRLEATQGAEDPFLEGSTPLYRSVTTNSIVPNGETPRHHANPTALSADDEADGSELAHSSGLRNSMGKKASLDEVPLMPVSSFTDNQTRSLLGLTESNSVLRHAHKYARKGQCEIITISGNAGLGKTCLVQSVQPVARAFGYFATAKFDQVRRTPFEPVLKVMSSLFRQIFSEGDVNTDFHNSLRLYVRPVWSILSSMLDLPEWLLGTFPSNQAQLNTLSRPSSGPRRSSSPAKGRLPVQCGGQGNTAADFLRTGTSTKSSRFTAIYIDTLRFLATQRLILFCLDDLQFADEESLELLQNMVSAQVSIAVILTFRDLQSLSPKVRSLVLSESASITAIQLRPLMEDEVSEYVSATLHREKSYCFPLVAVILEKTGGNPFFVREMLDVCHRKKSIWYSWKDSEWQYNLDSVFEQFESQAYGSQINNEFILTRLMDLPSHTRTFLAWASLLGSTFSYPLVKKLMLDWDRGQDHNSKHKHSPDTTRVDLVRQSSQDVVTALQAGITAYIIMPGEDDTHFRFCHDRYQQAASALVSGTRMKEMHLAISEALVEGTDIGENSVFIKASHICASVELIKKHIEIRSPYRDVLFQAAEKATESGGRSAGLNYFANALKLLQKDPWNDELPDAYYSETLTLFMRSAECYWFLGYPEPALALIQTTLKRARDSVDKVPAWVLQSRLYSRRGDNARAFEILRHCLHELGVVVSEPSWDDCDRRFKEVSSRIEQLDKIELLQRPLTEDRRLITIGSVFCEIMAAAYWTDTLMFYQLALTEMELNLNEPMTNTTQAGLPFIHVAACAVGRFGMLRVGCDIGDIGKNLLDLYSYDTYTAGRGYTLYAMLVGHVKSHLKNVIAPLEVAVEASITSGDRLFALLGVGFLAGVKLWSSVDLVEVESFCRYGAEELVNWQDDLRGGVFLTAVRQFSRALLGRTATERPETTMSDADHDTSVYFQVIDERSPSPRLSKSIYLAWNLAALYMFGHYQAAIDMGRGTYRPTDSYYSVRIVIFSPMWLSFASIALLREVPDHPHEENWIQDAQNCLAQLKHWGSVNDVNYAAWAFMLEAELAEHAKDWSRAVQSYEAGMDHAEVHGLGLEFAMAAELFAEFLIRKGSRRPAKGMLTEAITAYRKVSAIGKANHVNAKHEWLLKGTSSLRTVDQGTQTFAPADSYAQVRACHTEDVLKNGGMAFVNNDRTQAWLNPKQKTEGDGTPMAFESLGLDMIDLQGILTSTQVLSSELQVDSLLSKMSQILRDITGAEFSAIVISEEDSGWIVGSESNNTGTEFPPGQLLESVKNAVGKGITLYCLRFKEVVYLHNVFDDERFGNVPVSYRKRRPEGRSVIAVPILRGDQEILGCVYLEGPPHTFSERNVSVVGLLVNSISISLTNARLFKRVEKVSASNAVMVEAQKLALTQAHESEKKAKAAEAEAVRNMRLKEEAAKAKSMFLANVSHELRTPLNGVIGMSELLKGSRLNSEQAGYADSIRVCADTLLTVINDILDFSKLEAGKMQMFSVPLSLTETIAEVVRALSYSNKEKDLRTIMQLDLDKDLLVMGDPVRLHQILMNLLSNSYKFTPQGSVTVRAVVEQDTEKEITVTCSVADTGCGITEEQMLKLFLPFSQADSSTARTHGGTGLGLSICKAIIENVMKGRIWMESTINVGTKVSFTLTFAKVIKGSDTNRDATTPNDANPMAIFSPPALSPAVDSPHLDLSAVPRDRIRICIAEDNPINQKIAITYVQKLGFAVEAFGDGRQAVNALVRANEAGNPFHIVLMDVQMPVLDGYDATREIRRHPDPAVRRVLVIAMTASAIRGDREKCLEAGMNNYLAKPVRPQMLRQMLDSYVTAAETGVKGVDGMEGKGDGAATKGKGATTTAEAGPKAGVTANGGAM